MWRASSSRQRERECWKLNCKTPHFTVDSWRRRNQAFERSTAKKNTVKTSELSFNVNDINDDDVSVEFVKCCVWASFLINQDFSISACRLCCYCRFFLLRSRSVLLFSVCLSCELEGKSEGVKAEETTAEKKFCDESLLEWKEISADGTNFIV